jgi:type III pantothenate kinase
MTYGILDIGNTYIKLYAKNQDFILLFKEKEWEQKKIEKLISGLDKLIISNVRYTSEQMEKHISDAVSCPFILLSKKTPLPITLNYDTPQTLGKDRIATAVAAYKLFPNKNNVIFDIGSCMTIDFIDKKGVFHGGRISPGLEMRLKAMHHFTGKLPLVEKNSEIGSVEKSTTACMQSGAFWGLFFEIEGTIEDFKKRYSDINVILTGGDANMFDKRLKSSIFADSFFLLKGLENILIYNDQK